MATDEVPRTQIAVRLQQAMDAEKFSINDAAREFDLTYEYVRRVVRGLNIPSKTVLILFCQRFKWDYKEMENLLVQDRFRARNGEFGAVAQQFEPEVQPFERGWSMLDSNQKGILLAQLQLFLAQNKRHFRK